MRGGDRSRSASGAACARTAHGHGAPEELDVFVRAKPACPARDVTVVVTLTGPNGRPPCRIGSTAFPAAACNENRRMFD